MSADVRQCPPDQILVFRFWSGSARAAVAPRLSELGTVIPVRTQPFAPPARPAWCILAGESISRFRQTAADVGGHWRTLADVGCATLTRPRSKGIPRAGIMVPAGITGRDPIPSFRAAGTFTFARGMFFCLLENRSKLADFGGHWRTSADIHRAVNVISSKSSAEIGLRRYANLELRI